jgi:hypothetical protein
VPYIVIVGRFWQAESPDFPVGPFTTPAEALAEAKRIVERSLIELAMPGMSPGQLYDRYMRNGQYPRISSEGEAHHVEFDAESWAMQHVEAVVESLPRPERRWKWPRLSRRKRHDIS